jgi:excisionase family DNA binding protein
MIASVEPTFWTVEALSTRWQVSQRTVRRLIERGQLRAVRIGGQLRVAADVLQRFEERHEVQRPVLPRVSTVGKQ